LIAALKSIARDLILQKVYARLDHAGRNRVHALLNKRHNFTDLSGVTRSNAAVFEYRRKLADVAKRARLPENAGYIHFVYGFKDRDELPLYAFIAIQSARFHNPGWPVGFAYVQEPTGIWWERLRDEIECIQLADFDYFRGARFYHYAHKADVIRQLALHDLGGVYLDIDTLTRRNFLELRKHEFGMAVQGAVNDSAAGLCNAVMWGWPQARFLSQWLASYSSFRSKGRDGQWDYHSVRLPAIMLREHSELITILDHRAFFNPLWPDVERVMFSENGARWLVDVEAAYGFHLWNGAIEKRLRSIDLDWLRTSQSLYACIARPAMANFL
jgi:hypothetical protein